MPDMESLDRAVEEARVLVFRQGHYPRETCHTCEREIETLIAAVSERARAEERERTQRLVDAALAWQNRRNEWFDARLTEADVFESVYERAKDDLADAVDGYVHQVLEDKRARSSEEAGG